MQCVAHRLLTKLRRVRQIHRADGKGLSDYDAIFGILTAHRYRGWVSIEDGMNGMEERAESLASHEWERRLAERPPGRPSPGNTTLLAVITNQKRLGRAVKPFVGTLSEKREKREGSRAQRRPPGHLRIGLILSGSRFSSGNPCENRGKTAAFRQ